MEFETEIENAKVSVYFDYQPEEAMVRYYPDGTGHSGCAASVDNVSVYWQNRKFNSEKRKLEDVEIDITDLLDELGYDVEELCWGYLSNLED